MTHGSLFSGIGGFDLAAQWMGWENIFHCEWNEFGQKVLKYHFPKSISYNDITKTDFTIHRGKIDILTGGFPCQPYSSAGKRKGKEDERHLWPEMLRAIREIQPRWVVGENVLGLVNWSRGLVFHEVQADLEAAGYEVWPYVLPAVSVNAPHRRDRVWFVAHPNSNGLNQRNGNDEGGEYALGNFNEGDEYGDVADTSKVRLSSQKPIGELGRKQRFTISNEPDTWEKFPTQSPICSRNDGLSSQLDGITFSKWKNESIKAAGNAIVPQVVLPIFKAIQEYESLINKNPNNVKN